MEEYITVTQAAEKWGLTKRQVQNMCSTGRLADVRKEGNRWMISCECERPADGRVKSGNYIGWRRKKKRG